MDNMTSTTTLTPSANDHYAVVKGSLNRSAVVSYHEQERDAYRASHDTGNGAMAVPIGDLN